ncbi:hypothetical protein ACTA71_005372 [Dictyostelium dimigraforme]
MNKFTKLIFLIFLFLILSRSVNSQDLNKKEYNCLETFLTNLGSISLVNKGNKTSEYDFCNPLEVSSPIQISCSQGSIILLSIVHFNRSFIIKEEVSCFTNIIQLFIENVNYNSSLFFNSFPNSLSRVSLSGENLQFSKIGKNLQYFTVSLFKQTIPTILKFSWFSKTLQMFIGGGLFISNKTHSITYENDLGDSEMWETSYFNSISLNIPSFRNINGFIQFELLEGYNQSSWSNIKDIESNIFIRSSDLTVFPNDQLASIRSILPNRINIEVPFINVNKMCDLSLISKSMEILSFTKGGRDFTFGGLMPIILPNNQGFKKFVFQDGYIKNFEITQYGNAESIELRNNSMSGVLPSVKNLGATSKLIYIDISNNQITGEMDDSYCEFDIIVTNNLMTGPIPSCFTCFFALTEISLKDRFMGNNFTNLDQPSSPSTISPNLMYSNFELYRGQYHHKYFIFGENIGGGWASYSQIIGFEVSFQIIRPNKIFAFYSISKLPSIVTFSYSKTNPKYRFTLSADLMTPKVNKVDWVTDSENLIFEGSYFSYNVTIINITIGGVKCQVNNANFYNINCTLLNPIDTSLNDILSFITIGNLTTQFTLNPGVINNIQNCKNDCSGGGICISDIGKCQCDPTHIGDDCSIDYIECLNQCNNNIGRCNTKTGICTCPTSPHAWIGTDCSIPLHAISGASPSNINGGIASIYGWFGNIHTGKQVFIGNQECTPIYNITETEIICNSPAGTGLKSISVIQNSINVTSKDIYQYYSNDKQCPNHCTSTLNGICNSTTGYCNCIGRWSGYDCSLYSNTGNGNNNGGSGNNIIPGSNTTVDDNTGNTNINNQQTNYEILITKLIEIDFNGNSINEYSLLNKWSIFSNISKTVYTFIQSIQNDQCNITYTIEEINNDREVSFAGINFRLTSGSVKMTVSIENYQYSSNLNTLQLQMKSSVSEIQTNDKNDCNNDQIEINSTSNQDNTLNYIAIKKDAKVLNGRFLDRIESDGKSTFMQTVLISKSNDSIIIGMNLPHCTKKCLLDPDFSVLVSPEFIDECNGGDKRESWFLPVVIIIPIVCITLIIIIGFLIIKKRFVEMYLFKSKIKQLANLK